MTDHIDKWKQGQQVLLGRGELVTIDKVSPSGRASVGERQFNPDGSERGVVYHKWRSHGTRIRALTPEISEKLEKSKQWNLVRRETLEVSERLALWITKNCWPSSRGIPRIEITEQAKNIVATLNALLPPEPTVAVDVDVYSNGTNKP